MPRGRSEDALFRDERWTPSTEPASERCPRAADERRSLSNHVTPRQLTLGSNTRARRDLDSYGDPNDIGPDDPAPRAPEGPPHTTVQGYQVWQFDPDAEARVPDGSGDNLINY
jgi:hypothetical protein